MTPSNPTNLNADRKPSNHYWIGRTEQTLNDWIGGCPYGSSLFAHSELFQTEVCILLPCKRWGCSHCGPVRCAQLSRRIAAARPTKFITLTVSNSLYNSPRHAYDSTRRAVSKFATAIRKRNNSFEYVRILEITAAGYPHYHFLARTPYTPQSFLSQTWNALTGAPIVDIRRIDQRLNIIGYVTKYIQKQLYCPFTTRRVAWSRKFFPPLENEKTNRWLLRDIQRSPASPASAMWQHWNMKHLHRVGPYAFAACSHEHWLHLKSLGLLPADEKPLADEATLFDPVTPEHSLP